MPDRQPDPTPEQLDALGLDAADLAGFDDGVREGTEADFGDQEVLLEGVTAPGSDAPPAPAPADQREAPTGPADRTREQPTPHAQAEAARKDAADQARPPSGSRTEEPAAPAPGTPAPAPAAPDAPKPTEEQPWTFAADGRRNLTVEGAVVDAEGNVRIPARSVPQLQTYLADRSVWRQKEQAYVERIRALDPEHNEQVTLARTIADEMTTAADPAKGGSDEKLWEWVQGFLDRLPVLREQAKAKALAHENRILRERIEPIEREQTREQLEPAIRDGIAEQLEAFLALEEYKPLAGQREQLARRLWELRSRGLIGVYDRDFPEHGIQRGQLYVDRDVLRTELDFARGLLGKQLEQERQDRERAAAAARNQAALGRPDVPPVPSAAGATLGEPDPGAAGTRRFRDREEYHEHMRRLAESR